MCSDSDSEVADVYFDSIAKFIKEMWGHKTLYMRKCPSDGLCIDKATK